MNKKDRKRIEKKLLDERDRLVELLEDLENSVLKRTQRESSGDLSAYSIHMADLGTDAMEREKDLQVATVEGRRLVAILEALQRLEDESFGICENCEKPIEIRRLEVVPHARFCLRCQQKADRASGS